MGPPTNYIKVNIFGWISEKLLRPVDRAADRLDLGISLDLAEMRIGVSKKDIPASNVSRNGEILFAEKLEVEFSADWHGSTVDQFTKLEEKQMKELALWGDGILQRRVKPYTDRIAGLKTNDIRYIFDNVSFRNKFYLVISPPQGNGMYLYGGSWSVGQHPLVDHKGARILDKPHCYLIDPSLIDKNGQIVIHISSLRGINVDISEVFLSSRKLSMSEVEELLPKEP